MMGARSPQELDRVFDRFYRGASPRRRLPAGWDWPSPGPSRCRRLLRATVTRRGNHMEIWVPLAKGRKRRMPAPPPSFEGQAVDAPLKGSLMKTLV